MLIDFGRSIDLHLYPEGTMFHGDNHCSGFDCVEMRTGRPWKYEIDIFGLCATAYVLLHGEYMELTYEPRARDGRHAHHSHDAADASASAASSATGTAASRSGTTAAEKSSFRAVK